jgi:hypothetical protein
MCFCRCMAFLPHNENLVLLRRLTFFVPIQSQHSQPTKITSCARAEHNEFRVFDWFFYCFKLEAPAYKQEQWHLYGDFHCPGTHVSLYMSSRDRFVCWYRGFASKSVRVLVRLDGGTRRSSIYHQRAFYAPRQHVCQRLTLVCHSWQTEVNRNMLK